MIKLVVNSGLVLGFLALAGAASAQVTLRGSQTAATLPAASSVTGPVRAGTPAIPAHNPNAEPKDMQGMLAAQNEMRARLGLPALTWSGELTSAAAVTAKTASGDLCSQAHARKTATADNASIYWTAPLKRLGGAGQAQSITPHFMVAEWADGRREYDLATATCRRSGTCEQYARMVSPLAESVGCAHAVCESQAQIWACRYSGPGMKPGAKSSAAKPVLRSRIGN